MVSINSDQGGRSVSGALTGTAIDAEETLAFSERSGIRARTETMPLERAADAYGKMMRNEARFRMVLLRRGRERSSRIGTSYARWRRRTSSSNATAKTSSPDGAGEPPP